MTHIIWSIILTKMAISLKFRKRTQAISISPSSSSSVFFFFFFFFCYSGLVWPLASLGLSTQKPKKNSFPSGPREATQCNPATKADEQKAAERSGFQVHVLAVAYLLPLPPLQALVVVASSFCLLLTDLKKIFISVFLYIIIHASLSVCLVTVGKLTLTGSSGMMKVILFLADWRSLAPLSPPRWTEPIPWPRSS